MTADTQSDHQGLTGQRVRNIADPFADLLSRLPRVKRRALVLRLSTEFYEGWRPPREEIADLVAVELKLLTIDDYVRRRSARAQGAVFPRMSDRVLRFPINKKTH